MPACFRLISKTTNQPTKFQEIDDAMRAEFGQPPDPDRWLEGWYDSVGFALAVGKDFQWCRENFEFTLPIVDYLDKHYTSDSWTEIGKR